MTGRSDVLRKSESESNGLKSERRTRARNSPARLEITRSPTKTRTKSPGRRKTETSPARPRGRPRSPSRQTISSKNSPSTKSYTRKSPTRKSPITKSPSRKSPSRKSPSRKSPSRKSPSRKSPARRLDVDREKSKTPITVLKSIEVDTESDSEELSDHSSMKSFKAKTPIKEIINNVIRRSSRLREVEERTIRISKSNYEAIAKLPEYSDEDEIDAKNIQEIPAVKSKVNYAASFAAITQVIVALSLFLGVLIICNDSECGFKIPNLNRLKSVDAFFDVTVFLFYTAFVLFIAILSALPFGGKKCTGLLNKSGKLHYVMNGLFSTIIVFAIVILMEFYDIRVCEFILDNFFKLAISSFILSLPLAVFLHIKSHYVPLSNLTTNATSNSGLVNFIHGSEINPRLFGVLDVKMIIYRVSLISWLLVACSGIYHSLGVTVFVDNERTWLIDIRNLNLNPTVLTISFMVIVFCTDVLAFEYCLPSTREIQFESVGYMKCLEHVGLTALYSLIPKFVLDYGVELDTWKLISCGIIFCVGYGFSRGSNLQKHAFRQNPYSPAVAHLESIPTGAGKKLICSGYWGFVRHPNYLGDILINLSYLPFVLWYPPCISIYITILFLVQRARMDNAYCKKRYGTSWDRYCQRVKYLLIPKVY